MNFVHLILPIFGIIAIGWLASATGWLSDKVAEGLSEYVFSLAVPALIVSTLTRADTAGEILPAYWVAYFGGSALTWAICAIIARRGLHKSRREALLHGAASSQSNTIFVGVPLILQVYGDAGSVPLFMLLAVHLPVMMGAATLLIESDSSSSASTRLLGLAKVLGRNPIFLSLVLGGVMRAAGIRLTGIPASLVESIGASASTCALLSLGMAMTRYHIRAGLSGASLVCVGKLLLHPLLVWVLAFHVLSMPPAFAGVATLFAAMPVGINVYLMAARYREGEGPISSAVVLTTFLSMGSLALWLYVLGRV
jgi:predicted permease